MEKKVDFEQNVMLIDAWCLNKMGDALKAYFEPRLKRELPKADLACMLECMEGDIGSNCSPEAKHQVFFVYDPSETQMDFCTPSDLVKELDAKAFDGPLGSFFLYSIPTSGLTTRESLFIDLLRLAGEAKEVNSIALLPDPTTPWEWTDYLSKNPKVEEKTTVFSLNPPSTPQTYHFKVLAYPLLAAFGVRAVELGYDGENE